MHDPELEQYQKADTETLSYFLTEAATGRTRVACFEPLTARDIPELQSEAWTTARFKDVWIEWVDEEHTFKLVVREDDQKQIQGLVRLGEVSRVNYSGRVLRDSLLETAPCNRYQALQRQYQGAGRVLVARMVVESYVQGGSGQLLVRPVAGSLPFYHSLGFENVRHTPYCMLKEADARVLLTQSLADNSR